MRHGTLPSLNNVKKVIIDYIQDSSWQNAAPQYIKLLIQSAAIEGVTFEES